MKYYDGPFFHTMELYDKLFFHKKNYQKKFILKFCVSSETLALKFLSYETQSVTGSYHVDKLYLVIFAAYVKIYIFTWIFMPEM